MRWWSIPGFPEYQISATGIVRRCLPARGTWVGRRMTPCQDKDGYIYVCLSGDRCFIHALVCETFHGPRPSPAHHATHRNGRLLHNHWRNLRWATIHENRMDTIAHLRTGKLGGGRAPFMSERQVRAIRRIGRSIKREVIASRYGCSKTHVTAILKRQVWKHVK